MSTTTVAAPDLSRLGLSEKGLAEIRVALTQGATWRLPSAPNEMWVAMLMGACGSILLTLYSGTFRDAGPMAGPWLGPDYRNDPAAWGPLMQREFCAWESDERGHRVKWYTEWLGAPVINWSPWAPTLPEAITLGTLKKHGVEGYT